MSKCLIIILEENESGIFYAGQRLKGYVELNLPRAKKCSGLRLKIKGNAICTWSEEKNLNTEHYIGQEKYLNYKSYLFGCKNGKSEKIEAGVYKFRFSCFLPPHLPSSFKTGGGTIYYEIEANLDIPWGIDDNMVRKLKIGRIDDLNLYADLKMPLQEKHFDEGSKLLSLEASIPYSGYTPGETINVAVKVINDSNKTVPKCKIELRQNVKYISRGAEKINYNYSNQVMVKVETQGVEKKTTASFNKQLVIPSNLTNTNVLFSKIIQITYEIRVTCKTKGYRYNPKVYIPITLGSIPLFFDEDFQPMYLQEDEEIDIPLPCFEQVLNQIECDVRGDEFNLNDLRSA